MDCIRCDGCGVGSTNSKLFSLLTCARIDPGNAFRIVVECAKFTANLEYGPLEMEDSRHDVWFDSRSVFNLSNFLAEMASNII